LKAVVLAAGDGTRLGLGIPKALVKVHGLTLLERSVRALNDAGVNDIVAIMGPKPEMVRRHAKRRGLAIRLVENSEYERGNAISVLRAEGHVSDRFLVVMVDHIFDPSIVRGLTKAEGEVVACVDSKPLFASVREATKVLVEGEKVICVGKGLKRFNAIDVGVFLCSRSIFPIVKECVERGDDEWSHCVREMARRGMVRAYDIKGKLWIDVDTIRDLRRARRVLRTLQIRYAPPHPTER